jgi:hypothetical protein
MLNFFYEFSVVTFSKAVPLLTRLKNVKFAIIVSMFDAIVQISEIIRPVGSLLLSNVSPLYFFLSVFSEISTEKKFFLLSFLKFVLLSSLRYYSPVSTPFPLYSLNIIYSHFSPLRGAPQI